MLACWMSFRLAKREPPAAGLRRICLEELDAARGELNAAAKDPLALHEVRKALKRVRALLQLARPALGAAARAEVRHLREISQLLARHREMDALCAIVRIEAKTAGSADVEALATAVRIHQDVHAPTGNRVQELERARRMLAGVRRRLSGAKWAEMSPELVRRRFRKTYKRARRDWQQAHEMHSADAAHEWRKSSKVLLNQGRLLRAWGATPLAQFRRELEKLDNALGRSRDCATLAAILHGLPAAETPLRYGLGLRARLETIARDEHTAAMAVGLRIFRRGGRSFVKRQLGREKL